MPVSAARNTPRRIPTSGNVHHNLKTVERQYGDKRVNDQVSPANKGRPAVSVYSRQDSFEYGGQGRSNTVRGPAGTRLTTHTRGPSLGLDYSAKAKAGLRGVDVDIKLKLDANLVSAGAKATRTFNVNVGGGERIQVKVNLAALGKVGADGSLNLKLHLARSGQVTGGLGISGFAGAKAGLTGGISVSHEGRKLMSGSLGVVASAGVSFEAGAKFKVGLSGVRYSAKAQATAGVGAGFKMDGTVSPKNVAILAAQAAIPGSRA